MTDSVYWEIYPWMTPEQRECFKFACYLFGGANHLHGKVSASCDNGISVVADYCSNHFATFDYSWLTKAVIVAHDKAIRFGIDPARGDRLTLHFHKRAREGSMSASHPKLDEVLDWIREDFSKYQNRGFL